MSAPTDDRLDLPAINPRRWTRIKAIAIRHAYVLPNRVSSRAQADELVAILLAAGSR